MSARIYTTPKLKTEANGRYEMETMHMFDTQADEEKALCGANVHAEDLTGVDYSIWRGGRTAFPSEPCASRARLLRSGGRAIAFY